MMNILTKVRGRKLPLHRTGGMVILLVVCSLHAAAAPVDPFVFALMSPQKITTLDNIDAHDTRRLTIEAQLLEGLMAFDLDNEDRPTENLAQEFHQIDPKTLVFRLRSDVIFHPHSHGEEPANAEKLSAEDVKFSLLRAKNSYTPLAYLLDNIDDITVVGRDLVKIKLRQPDRQLLAALANSIGHITCQEYYLSLGPDDFVRQRAFQKHPIGTGPYRLPAALDTDASVVTLELFGGYRDLDFVRSRDTLQSIVFRTYQTLPEIAEGLRSGEVQMTLLPMTDFGDGLGLDKTMGTLTPLDTPFLSILAFNLERPRLADAELRRILNTAIDPTKILDICPTNKKVLSEGILKFLELKDPLESLERSSGDLWQRPESRASLARLRQQGPLTLLMQPERDHIRDHIVQEVVRSFKEKLDIEIEIRRSENFFQEFLGVERNFDLFYIEWTPDTPLQQENLSILYPLFSSNSRYNFAKYSNAKVDASFEEILQLTNQMSEDKAYEETQEILREDAPFLWLPAVRHRAFFLTKNFSAEYDDPGAGESRVSSLLLYSSFLQYIREVSP